jgi:hypothetical protein
VGDLQPHGLIEREDLLEGVRTSTRLANLGRISPGRISPRPRGAAAVSRRAAATDR